MAHELSVEGIDILPDDAEIMFSTQYKITNFGRSPALDAFVTTHLFVQGVDVIDEAAIRKLCQPRPAGAELFLRFYRDIIGPGQSEEIIGFPLQSGIFVRETRSLMQAGMTKVTADFVLGGCITYKVLGSDAPHASGFAIRARKARPRIVEHGIKLEFDEIQIVAREKINIQDLMLTPNGVGSFRD